MANDVLISTEGLKFALHLKSAAGQTLSLLLSLPAKGCCFGAKIPKNVLFKLLKLQRDQLSILKCIMYSSNSIERHSSS